MQLPIVMETSALSAHRREVELVRWSLLAVPEHKVPRRANDRCDPLRHMESAPFHTAQADEARRP
jgi:hypothetical protein